MTAVIGDNLGIALSTDYEQRIFSGPQIAGNRGLIRAQLCGFLSEADDLAIKFRFDKKFKGSDFEKILDTRSDFVLVYQSDEPSRLVAFGDIMCPPRSSQAEMFYVVHHDHRGRGIGSFLVATMLELCRQKTSVLECKARIAADNRSSMMIAEAAMSAWGGQRSGGTEVIYRINCG